ncbi:MAG: bifunctional proline dehydrogenase/L-glutamate gamma-semialdehyde dehydrogenase PutA [Boseongicola sp.]|nr:bifunctional proline dehydrogenase/L-glutamate gamma-semialdehyde dehydrogenase PutA [Boseongicola sp.]
MTNNVSSRFIKHPDENSVVAKLIEEAALSAETRTAITDRAAALVRDIRGSGDPGMMEVFLAEYGLSTDEGIALMCLAEALLRVPDPETIDALIEDKIAPSDWGQHLGQSSSSLVNASTWALLLTGRVLDETGNGIAGALRGALKRLGEPVIRTAAKQAMREMGQQFVLGETMEDATRRATKLEAQGYTYSYDMLGEAALTHADAMRYFQAYSDAIMAAGRTASGDTIANRPGVSVKLSALHPRYEVSQRDRVLSELVPRLRDLARLAADQNIGLNIDAEEADRLELSLDVIEAVLPDTQLAGWDGFGVVVQAYGLRAAPVLDHLYKIANDLDRNLMVRLVKGAYWDTEIKLAQVEGLDAFPVFTSKAATDVSYLACARKLLDMTDRLYPQFATHNAHSVAAILEMATKDVPFEFQRLHGMGERLHELVKDQSGHSCRIYAPVGAHRDLLAYLVRRLLENGANSSFVHQIVNEDIPPEEVVSDPFDLIGEGRALKTGAKLYPDRRNSKGWDLTDESQLATYNDAREAFRDANWTAIPSNAEIVEDVQKLEIKSPSIVDDTVGFVQTAKPIDIENALSNATIWDVSGADRAKVLNAAADAYEGNAGALFACLAREAGKTPQDCVNELREAVDFLRYYATRTESLRGEPVGLVACVSPWNFPLAIFTGQIAGALAAGCGVHAKPAEQTPLVAALAVKLLHDAGVPKAVLQLLPGDGLSVGGPLTSDPRINAVAFTGSTETAKHIRRAMAENLAPGAPLIAETGGLNAMIIDSTALLEQAVRDVIASSFQSAGQRCSALRCVYVQDDIAEAFKDMLFGAMDELTVGNPWDHATDVGPLIDAEAQEAVSSYLQNANVLHQRPVPNTGYFVPPSVVEVGGIGDLTHEVFGPVLHLATFDPEDLQSVISDINSKGYGLTFGLHTRIDSRVQDIVEAVDVGNVYVNRNQIGAVVGTQPFGGEGLSGTGPKAGGPFYVDRFRTETGTDHVSPRDMPGPTGETNRLTLSPRNPILCLGPGVEEANAQAEAVMALGGEAATAPDLRPLDVATHAGISGAIWWGSAEDARAYAKALASREGPILPLITGAPRLSEVHHERHLCVDTTASGGNAALLAEAAS